MKLNGNFVIKYFVIDWAFSEIIRTLRLKMTESKKPYTFAAIAIASTLYIKITDTEPGERGNGVE